MPANVLPFEPKAEMSNEDLIQFFDESWETTYWYLMERLSSDPPFKVEGQADAAFLRIALELANLQVPEVLRYLTRPR